LINAVFVAFQVRMFATDPALIMTSGWPPGSFRSLLGD